MAARWENVLEGYDVNRFVGEVREGLLCTICQDVPKDPRLCHHKDHIFCYGHISRHLRQNSQTCPVCRDHLTPETLRRPTGFLKNYLEDLKIKCDHLDRGCPDVVRLEDLQRHVDQCGFAPVICGNEGCGTDVDRKDKEIHERYHCQFRIAKCHDCRDIKASQNGMKVQMTRMDEEIKVRSDFLRSSATIKIVVVNLFLRRNFTRYSFTVSKAVYYMASICFDESRNLIGC
jgi:E3 ubiquitin-protein ligase NRDP1